MVPPPESAKNTSQTRTTKQVQHPPVIQQRLLRASALVQSVRATTQWENIEGMVTDRSAVHAAPHPAPPPQQTSQQATKLNTSVSTPVESKTTTATSAAQSMPVQPISTVQTVQIAPHDPSHQPKSADSASSQSPQKITSGTKEDPRPSDDRGVLLTTTSSDGKSPTAAIATPQKSPKRATTASAAPCTTLGVTPSQRSAPRGPGLSPRRQFH